MAAVTCNGGLSVKGNTTLGDASSDTVQCVGKFLPRQVASTSVAGTEGEIVYCTGDKKAYVCTGTGDPATWAALN